MSETMRAIVVTEPGGPEVLQLRDVVRPAPGEREILVEVAASGLNRADLMQRRGTYPAPPGAPADIPGLEFSGTVAGVGRRVRRWSVGDSVMGIVGGGGYGEYVVTRDDEAVPAPGGCTLLEAGAIPEVFMTAFDALVLQEGLSSGETVLVHAVGSGVGTAALQLAHHLGARVIGTSRTPAKLERATALGLQHPVLADGDWASRVLEVTEGRGVEVILDLVGGSYLPGNQRVLGLRGRHIVVGVPGGPRAEVDLRSLMTKRGSIRGTVLRARPHEEKARLARAFEERVLPGFSSGALRPVIDRVFEPAEAAEAHRWLEAGETFGKVLLEW